MTTFWDRVDASGDCWLWMAGKNGAGYGVTYEGGGATLAHRWAYEALVGPIAAGLQLDHLCRVTACVNPDHLEPVTHAENIRRSHTPTAMNARKTHCKHGHEFTPENTARVRFGRKCRTCDRLLHREKWLREGKR